MRILSSLCRWWADADRAGADAVHLAELARAEGRRVWSRPGVEVFRDSRGEVRHVSIGSWRVIAASETRRIAEVRKLDSCRRVAVRIELADAKSLRPTCTIWELYNLQGQLMAMLQTADEQGFSLATDFQTGRVRKSGDRQPAGISA